MAAVLIPSFILLLLMGFLISPSLQHVSEAEPLVKFKNSVKITKGDLNSWRLGTDPCRGKWFGIYCHKGVTVSGIHVTQLGLSGTITVDDLQALPNLEEIHLKGNKFSGEIPPLSDINKNLKILDLSNNNLGGKVPESISNGKNLTLRLEGNHNLCGTAVNIECEPIVLTSFGESDPLAPVSHPGSKPSNAITLYAILVALTFLATFLIVVGAINKREEKKNAQFRMLDKERLSDLETSIKLGGNVEGGSSKRESSHNGKGGGGGGGGGEVGGGMGEIVMVNTDKGSFGLPHLMKAAAEVLGNGSLGSAYMAVMANGLSVVVKRIKDMNKLEPEPFDVEMRRLGRLRHPNVLTPLAYHYRREEKLVVSEYMPNSSLLYVLHGNLACMQCLFR